MENVTKTIATTSVFPCTSVGRWTTMPRRSNLCTCKKLANYNTYLLTTYVDFIAGWETYDVHVTWSQHFQTTQLLLLYQLICDVFFCCMNNAHPLKSEEINKNVHRNYKRCYFVFTQPHKALLLEEKRLWDL
jgi:hypothetical protein